MHRFRLHRFVVAVAVILGMLLQGTWVLAGTTGQITGTLNDSTTHKAVAGAKVSALSPSQAASATTDSQGRFTFLSLAPDTYSISVDVKGYQSSILNGITVQADQTQTLALTAAPSLQTIGRTQSRAASDVIKAGQTADVYSISAAQASAATALGGGGSLNQAYSAIASVPGVFVPTGQEGWAQSVYVRGGNYTQLGYEYDGVPVQRAYDAYPSSTLSALGQQEVQLYTGSQPGSAQSNGLAGFVNQVIKTGTYPGTATAELGIGAPTFYHKAQIEFGGASPDRNFSYYLATAGYNQSTRYVDQFDGASARYNYGAYNYASISQNCGTPQATVGCYHNGFGSGPNGYLYLSPTYGQDQALGDREFVSNFHIGIPHKKDGLKDDIQVLGSISYLFLGYNDAYNSYGSDVTSFFNGGPAAYNGQIYQQCVNQFDPNPVPCANSSLPIGSNFNYNNRSIYTGPTGGALTAANLSQVSPYVYPASPSGIPIHAAVNPNNIGNEKINDAIFKAQYTHAMGPNAYARVYAYSLYSDWLNNDPNGSNNPLAFVPSDYILPTHTRGVGLTLADQLGNHLLSLTGGYSTANLSRWNNSFPSNGNPVAVLVDSTNPTGGCYDATGKLVFCTAGARYTVPGTNKTNGAGGYPTALVAHGFGGVLNPADPSSASGMTCGNGPCEFLAVGSGLNGSFNNVSPHFSNLTLSDAWNVTPQLALDLAVRYDSFLYDVPSATSPQGPNPGNASVIGRTLFTNSYNQFNCFSSATGIVGLDPVTGACPAGTQHVAFNNNNPTNLWFGGFQPRLGATYKVNSLNVLRIGYGRFLQPSSTAYTFYNRAAADIASYDVPKFYAYGFNTAAHSIPPEESWNLDFSWEHQTKGSDLSWKISPFVRKTRNEDINVILDPVTNFVSAIPALSSDIKGIEMLLRKGDFSRNGFAGQLSYTYTHVASRYQTLPGGATALDNVNNAIRQYNAYTSFCATNPSDKRCNGILPTNGVTAAPCYTPAVATVDAMGNKIPAIGNPGTGGGADPTCAAGSIANPYWNAPVQALFDPNATYAPYNQTFGTGFSSNAASYNFPHVAALILNYKHDKWAVTPSFQFAAGGKYGSPVMGIAVDPAATGCTSLANPTAGDPRYPYGAPGGAAYDAQGCNGFLTGPDPFTQKFDTPGQFTEPSQLTANLGVSYEATKRLKLSILAVNLYGTCFGGSREPWTNDGPKIGCSYNAATGLQAGNFYNPGNGFQHQAYPYFPVTGGIAGQQAYGTNVNPLQVFFTAQLKL